MKTLATLTAVVALVAGVAVANAQSSGMSKSSGSMGSSSSMGSKMGNGKFCLQPTGSSSNSMDCKFASMAACQKEAKMKSGNCIPNSKSGTTGMK